MRPFWTLTGIVAKVANEGFTLHRAGERDAVVSCSPRQAFQVMPGDTVSVLAVEHHVQGIGAFWRASRVTIIPTSTEIAA